MMRIILADDKKYIRLGIASMLQEAFSDSITVEMCRNGLEVISCLESAEYDLLITDIRMPKMDGLVLMREARKIRPALQVVVVSGYDDFKYAQQSIHYGAQAYLLKPINKEEMIEVVEKAYQQSLRYTRECQKQKTYIRTVETMFSSGGVHNIHIKRKAEDIERLPSVLCSENNKQWEAFVNSLKEWKEGNDADIVFLLLYQSMVSLAEIYLPEDTCTQEILERFRISLENMDLNICMENGIIVLDQLRKSMLDQKRRHCDKADIQYAITFIEKNYAKDINLDMAANAASLNYSYFSHAFKEYTKESFLHYLTKIRITKAKEYLSETELKVYEVAEKVGFQSDKHFVRTFKKIVGVTPVEYRNSEKVKKIKRSEANA